MSPCSNAARNGAPKGVVHSIWRSAQPAASTAVNAATEIQRARPRTTHHSRPAHTRVASDMAYTPPSGARPASGVSTPA